MQKKKNMQKRKIFLKAKAKQVCGEKWKHEKEKNIQICSSKKKQTKTKWFSNFTYDRKTEKTDE